jgi:hypothetical protein
MCACNSHPEHAAEHDWWPLFLVRANIAAAIAVAASIST